MLWRMIKSDRVRELVVSLNSRDARDSVELLDAAYWVKGCSSLGRLRYAALLRVGTGKGSSLCLIDIKEAVAAAAPRTVQARMPGDHAVRVVTGAQALSPNLGQRMLAARLLDRAVVIRELMPQDLKIEVDRLTQQEAMTMAHWRGGARARTPNGCCETPTVALASGQKPDLIFGRAVVAVVERRRTHRSA